MTYEQVGRVERLLLSALMDLAVLGIDPADEVAWKRADYRIRAAAEHLRRRRVTGYFAGAHELPDADVDRRVP